MFRSKLSLAVVLFAFVPTGCIRVDTGNPLLSDRDGDGVTLVDGDCDDEDPASATKATDRDCDGLATAMDCDDGDPAAPALADDGDCDGVLTADDCDDGDSSATVVSADADCDGVLTVDDCDDLDSTVTVRPDVDDADCDGIPTHAGGGDLIRIAAGSFDMGCTTGQSGCDPDEYPVMPVTLTHDYYIGETEVTQGEFAGLGRFNTSYWTSCGSFCPVEGVSWDMAASYTNELSSAAGLTLCYSCTGTGTGTSCTKAVDPYLCDGYRLPTEAEWEGAARCGDGFLHAGSGAINDVGWVASNAEQTQPVAGKQANSCGLFDMSGNVWEWIHDSYGSWYYTATGRVDPSGPGGRLMVIRGGAYSDPSVSARVANREKLEIDEAQVYLGFRVARTIP
jgi:formylglycine-generating enzyme required for sulfatase activity